MKAIPNPWFRASTALFLLASAPALAAQNAERVDLATLGRIQEEGLKRSQVMDHLGWLADVYGPRLTGSPGFERAGEWAMKKLREWGLANVTQERFPFGRGWSLERFSAHLVEPQVQPLIGLPKSWTPGTNGVMTADVVRARIGSETDFEKYRGKLKGKIVLTQPERAVHLLDGRVVLVMNEQDLAEARSMPIPAARSGAPGGTAAFQTKVRDFYRQEGVVALFDRGNDSDMADGGSDLSWTTQVTDGGTIFVGRSGSPTAPAGDGVPQVVLAVEHYNRMVRILEKGLPVKVELNIRVRYHEETRPNGFNILAEIPGTDLKDEVVMIGAHFDSHHGATGATDNAAGSAAMMEAMRILTAVGARPRRTIRLGLWGAEENGIVGSRLYVRQHLGDPVTGRMTPEHAKFSAYFNIDNGTGRIRGIWLQENLVAGEVFREWQQYLAPLGVDVLAPRSVGSTDHVSFDAVGLPAFQFVQERLEYRSRTHHTNMDTVDHVVRDDMVQMATVAATFAWLAANRDGLIPRKQ